MFVPADVAGDLQDIFRLFAPHNVVFDVLDD